MAMAMMEPMTVPYAAHADHAAPVTDVTSAVSEGANVTSAETATDMASAEATTTEAATHSTHSTMTAAGAATAMTAAHQHQQTALCSQIGVTDIHRPHEGCRGRKSKRKCADDSKREDAAFHDCTSRGHLHDKFIASPQAIAAHLQLATDSPPSGFFLRSMQAKLSLWLAKRKPTCSYASPSFTSQREQVVWNPPVAAPARERIEQRTVHTSQKTNGEAYACDQVIRAVVQPHSRAAAVIPVAVSKCDVCISEA